MATLLIHGVNQFAADEHYQEKINEFLLQNSRESIHAFDGEQASSEEVAQALAAQSLFSTGSELVVIRRVGSNSELKDKLVELIDEIPESTELIIYDPTIDKRSKLYKLLKKSGSTIEFTNLTEHELNNWISQRIEQLGGSVEPGATKMLADRTKGDQVRLKNEIDKLISYDKTVTQGTVQLLIDKSPDDNVFELLNKVAADDKRSAQKKYDELLRAQVEPHYVLVMICWQLSNMLAVKSGEGTTDTEIASKLGMNPYAVSRTKQIVRSLKEAEIRGMAEKALLVDTKTKTTSVDVAQAVRQLIAEL